MHLHAFAANVCCRAPSRRARKQETVGSPAERPSINLVWLIVLLRIRFVYDTGITTSIVTQSSLLQVPIHPFVCASRSYSICFGNPLAQGR